MFYPVASLINVYNIPSQCRGNRILKIVLDIFQINQSYYFNITNGITNHMDR